MHALAKEGNKGAALVNKIRDQKENLIGAILLGNNVVNIAASAVATGVLITIFGAEGVFYATIVMTALVLIFSEVLPKTYAFYNADKLAMILAPLLRIVIFLFTPVTALISKLVTWMLKVIGADVSKADSGNHLDVLRGVIDLHQGPEESVSEERAMLRSILDLGDVEIGKIMIHRKQISTIDADLPVKEIVAQVLENAYSRIPLWKDEPDNIVGVIHVKTLLREMQDHAGHVERINIRDLITEPWFVPETTTLRDQLQAFRKRREHFALVVDEYGTLRGAVTLEDILEEIVGDIDDEKDDVVAGVRRQPNGSYMIDGDVTIRELNREYEWALPDGEDYSTIAGLLLHESESLPEVGQSFRFFGFRFDVVKRQRNHIALVRVTPPQVLAAEDQRKVAGKFNAIR